MTIAKIKTKWEQLIFTDATLLSYCSNLHSYDLLNTVAKSNAHEAKLYSGNCLQFVQFIFTGRTRKEMFREEALIYNVRVDFYKECDLTGNNFNTIINFHEALYGIVKNKLKEDWGGLINFWNVAEEIPSVNSDNINGVPVWFSSQNYNANFI